MVCETFIVRTEKKEKIVIQKQDSFSVVENLINFTNLLIKRTKTTLARCPNLETNLVVKTAIL